MLDCATDLEKAQRFAGGSSGDCVEQAQDIESEEVEASPAYLEPETAKAESKLTWDESEASSAQIELETANTESEITWQEIEDEWFEFGSDFLVF